MKLSEIIAAIDNEEIIDDRENPENVDVMIMIQDATDIHHVKVLGVINGNDDRIARMVADRMVKAKYFRNMITNAVSYWMCFVNAIAHSNEHPESDSSNDEVE